MSIYKKLHSIQKEIKGLGKDKKSYGFDYVTGNKLLRWLKPKMNDLGLLLKQEIISIDNERIDYKVKSGEKSEILSKVMMRFTWIDVDTVEKDVNLFGANGQNDWEKGLGSALTYGERYFLLKYFHIATDEDDIDNPNRKLIEEVAEVVKTKGLANKDQMDKIKIYIDKVGYPKAMIEANNKFQLTSDQVTELQLYRDLKYND